MKLINIVVLKVQKTYKKSPKFNRKLIYFLLKLIITFLDNFIVIYYNCFVKINNEFKGVAVV